MPFKPEEIILSPTSLCNLNCAHCSVKRNKAPLSTKKAMQFLNSAKKTGIDRVSISGGEPFLKPVFLYKTAQEAAKNGMLFNRIMTNGVWFEDKQKLQDVLNKLLNSGYLGEICLSLDAFHKQELNKLVLFVKTAVSIFKRADII